MLSVWIAKPGIQLGGNTFHSLMQRIKGTPATHGPVFLSLFQSHSHFLQRRARFRFFDGGRLLCLLYSAAARCYTPSVLISPDQNTRSNQTGPISAASFSFHQAFCCPCRWACSSTNSTKSTNIYFDIHPQCFSGHYRLKLHQHGVQFRLTLDRSPNTSSQTQVNKWGVLGEKQRSAHTLAITRSDKRVLFILIRWY